MTQHTGHNYLSIILQISFNRQHFVKKVGITDCRYSVSVAESPVTITLTVPETVPRDCLVKNIDSLQITVHSLTINNIGRHRYENSVHSGFPLTESLIRQLNLLHKLSEQHGTVYFVEYELPVVERVTQDLRRCVKETRPRHTSVKRFCSRKKAGSGNYPVCNLIHIHYCS
jgi:hypothetical protein